MPSQYDHRDHKHIDEHGVIYGNFEDGHGFPPRFEKGVDRLRCFVYIALTFSFRCFQKAGLKSALGTSQTP